MPASERCLIQPGPTGPHPFGACRFAPVQTAYKPSAVFSAKLRKLGLREETIGYEPSREKWEEWYQVRQEN
jgi:hypothetical protein